MKLKFVKKTGYQGTIRKVWTDDKEVMLGLVGTVADFLKEGIFDFCDYPPETWCYLPDRGILHKPWLGATREDALINPR